MKIQAINSTNFKGLFTNKTSQNGGNWLMEYSPYSWENNNTSKMAPKENFKVSSSYLPDNEEVYRKTPNLEYSEDILNTTSYYRDYRTGKMRRTITEVPAMNREESLRVLEKKLDAFLDIKYKLMEGMKDTVLQTRDAFKQNKEQYDIYSQGYDAEFWKSNKNVQKSAMDRVINNLSDKISEAVEKMSFYAGISDSIRAVAKRKAAARDEIAKLAAARQSGNLIDISRRDIVNPNRELNSALWNFGNLDNQFETSKNASKLVALPHKTISIGEIIKAIKAKGAGLVTPSVVLEHVENMIKKSV